MAVVLEIVNFYAFFRKELDIMCENCIIFLTSGIVVKYG